VGWWKKEQRELSFIRMRCRNGTDFVCAMIRAAASPTAVCGSEMYGASSSKYDLMVFSV